MNSRLRFLVWMVLDSVLVPCSQYLVAEEHLIKELVVTVRKRVEHLSEVPVSLTILNNAGIKEKGISELNQLEKFAPNTIQTNFGQGSTGHAAAFMRGIGLQDHIITTDPAVGIYLDGDYLGRNTGANMDLVNLERVEVVRGPQGTLSGRNTLGGALNIVTREPSESTSN
ncbi:MAG: TonB-dependent receptor [Gammaproteobacteria bacterium]|nr:TonB-dependent receptor [Gammaproteobacteria bacterium]MYD80961.1 TonB-dependent receptor [Gammaproteobacteria bacterium]